MLDFEYEYAKLVRKILKVGKERDTRNAKTKAIFGEQLKIDELRHGYFPILQGRKMFYKGVLGELAAMLRQPKHLDDFKVWGCNYWELWANADGSINVDYGNAWFDFNGFNQIEALKDKLKNNPTDRRMIINGWRPDNLGNLSLPCCHYSYQFYVDTDGYLDMIWIQRSVDTMIGLPSDIIFAAAWLVAIANEFGYKPGTITMQLGDCHLYESHWETAEDYLANVEDGCIERYPMYDLLVGPGCDFTKFEPTWLTFNEFKSYPKLNLELYS